MSKQYLLFCRKIRSFNFIESSEYIFNDLCKSFRNYTFRKTEVISLPQHLQSMDIFKCKLLTDGHG